MGRTRQERRAAQRRRTDQRLGRAGTTADWAARPLDELVAAGAQHAPTGSADAAAIVELLAARPAEAGAAVGARLADAFAVLWEHGWQPADAVHAARRLTDGRTGRLAARVVVAQAAATDAFTRAPEAWVNQLRGLGVKTDRRPPAGLVDRWADDEDLDPADALTAALTLLGVLWARPDLPLIGPPPSRWSGDARGAASGAASQPADDVDPKVLGRIRGLLAKAEGTTFPEEADAFTTKAQELMTRHAIDHAVVRAAGGPTGASAAVGARRVPVHDPHAEAKADLLAVVAEANGGRLVWDDEHGLATVMAHPGDLELIELLFTSLLVQATQAAAATGPLATRQRAPAFRRAFLTAFADRIGERLEEAARRVEDEAVARHGAALVPALAARTDAVEAAVRAAFGPLGPGRMRSFDAEGWDAGRLAADRARLGSRRGALPR